MLGRARPGTTERGGPRRRESARLAARWRLTAEAIDTLNGRLAALAGAASSLGDQRRDPAALRAACSHLEDEAERCRRLAAALLARPPLAVASSSALDLVARLRGLRPVVEASLGSRFPLELVTASTPVRVLAHAELEALVVLLIERCCQQRPAGGPLRLVVERDCGSARLLVEVLARADGDGIWRSPDARLSLEDARQLAAPFGAGIELEETAEALRLTLRLPLG